MIPFTWYQHRRDDLKKRTRAFEQQEHQLLAQADRQTEIAGIVKSVEDFCKRIQNGLQHSTFEQKRQLVELLIDRVIVNDGDVEIHYVIPLTSESEHIRFCHLRSDYFGAPNLVRALNGQPAQQIRIDLMSWRGECGAGLG